MNTPTIDAKKYDELESILLAIEVPHWDWLRCKGTTPNVYQAIIEAMFAASLNRQGCRWVKASEFEYKPRKRYFAKWEEGYPPDMAIKSSGWFQESDGTFFWHEQGFVPVGADEHDKLYILDESIEPCATSSEIGFAEWIIKEYQPNFAILGQGVSNWTYKGLEAGKEFYTTEQLYKIYKGRTPSPTGDRDCEELKKEVERLKEILRKIKVHFGEGASKNPYIKPVIEIINNL